jgi:hypothetical protein
LSCGATLIPFRMTAAAALAPFRLKIRRGLRPCRPEIPRGAGGQKSASWKFPVVFKRFGLARFMRGTAKPGADADPDAYLLVLLADQELTVGRDEQAEILIDAAFAAFDRQTPRQTGRIEHYR